MRCKNSPNEPDSGFARFFLVDPELDAIRLLPLIPRLLVALLMGVVGLIVGMLGFLLAFTEHWAAKLFSIAVVEPMALFLLCCSVYCVVPASPVGRMLAFAYRRARVSIWILFSVVALATVSGLAWFGVSRLAS